MTGKNQLIFQPAEILLPAVDLRRWSVIACDQYTSNGEYWDAVERFVGDAPSSLRLMLPEYYLGRCDENAAARRIRENMNLYLSQGIFRVISDSLVYLERTTSAGKTRFGLVGVIDLEAYDYSAVSTAPVRATEHTVEDRLPPRIKVRSEACLEMPHIMLLLNDPENTVMSTAKKLRDELLYDYDLMGGGGHLRGYRIHGEPAWRLAELASSGDDAFRLAVGDGNHSLAAARAFWLKKRQSISPEQRASDPARFALVELVNIHDRAISFLPIHRVLLHTNTDHWFREADESLSAPDGREIVFLRGNERHRVRVDGRSIGELIDCIERFCRAYCDRHGGELDYIHGDDEAASLSSQSGCCGVLLPQMEKPELFSSVAYTGPLPRKSFSIGLGPDKRYYLECRRIQ